MPETFERLGKEEAPVAYDAAWIISRSADAIRPKVSELIDLLRRVVPRSCEFEFGPRQFRVRYNGVRCVHPYIQLKKVWVQVTHKGGVRGMEVTPQTDLNAPALLDDLGKRLRRTCEQIDAGLARARP